MTIAVLAIYLTLVLSIGLVSHRLFRGTGEDYFVATRSIGPFVLLMSLFGTHMTAFSLLGASAEAYRQGIGVFALMASSSALVAPVIFYFVGTRLWAVGKRHGYLTQVQYFRERFQSPALGLLLFVVLTGLLIPYLLIGVLGGGISIVQVTGGQVPQWLGSLIVAGVVLTYVTYGGLRGTAWANTFQTLVFMILGAVTFFVIVRHLGGLPAALQRVAEAEPALLVRGEKVPVLKLASYTLIPLSVGMFPHIFMHWLSAKKLSTFRLPMIAYPLCVAAVWIPSVLIGVLGAADFPGLVGPEANTILVRMIGLHAPELVAALLTAGVFAAIMSSLDSQVLSLSTMFTQDIVGRFGFKEGMPEARQVWFGRLFVVAVLLVTYLLSLYTAPSIFRLGIWSFTGFAALFPLAVAGLYWRRATAAGAIAAVVVTAGLWITFFLLAGDNAAYTVGGTGIMPVAVILAASTAALVGVSWLTKPPPEAVVGRFFKSTGG